MAINLNNRADMGSTNDKSRLGAREGVITEDSMIRVAKSPDKRLWAGMRTNNEVEQGNNWA